MPKLLLEANGIIVEFGVRRVLDIDRIRIYDGERVGLIGENGAGKTTLLDVLSGTRTLETENRRRMPKSERDFPRRMCARDFPAAK